MDLRLIKPPASSSGRRRSARRPADPRPSRPACSSALPGGGTITPLLPGTTIDTDGDGKPDSGLSILPIDEADIDLDTNTGTIELGGGLVISRPRARHRGLARRPGDRTRRHPGRQRPLRLINGVRVKVGDIDTNTLDINSSTAPSPSTAWT